MKVYLLNLFDESFGDDNLIGIFTSEEEAKVMIASLEGNSDSRFTQSRKRRYSTSITEREIGEIFPDFHEFFGVSE